MCCFPLGFSALAVKVMRDGDGDGRCQEEDDKWVPCPPGVASGTRLRNGKPLGQTIGQLAATSQIPDPTPAELEVIRRGATFIEWYVSDPIDLGSGPRSDMFRRPARADFDNTDDFFKAHEEWKKRAEAEYARLVEVARQERLQRLSSLAPNVVTEEGTVDPQAVEDYLREKRGVLAALAQRRAVAAQQVQQRNREAARRARELMPSTIDINKDIPQDLQDALKEMFTHSFVAADGETYTTEVTKVGPTVDGKISVMGNIRTADGEYVGMFDRRFMGDNFSEMWNEVLMIEVPHQRKGIATVFNAMNEQLYKEMGISKIATEGVSEQDKWAGGPDFEGAHHWALHGFNWTPQSKRRLIEMVQRALARENDRLFPSAAERAVVEELVRRALQQADDSAEDAVIAGDLLHWRGARGWLTGLKAKIGYERTI